MGFAAGAREAASARPTDPSYRPAASAAPTTPTVKVPVPSATRGAPLPQPPKALETRPVPQPAAAPAQPLVAAKPVPAEPRGEPPPSADGEPGRRWPRYHLPLELRRPPPPVAAPAAVKPSSRPVPATDGCETARRPTPPAAVPAAPATMQQAESKAKVEPAKGDLPEAKSEEKRDHQK
jgi:hypothetical protein